MSVPFNSEFNDTYWHASLPLTQSKQVFAKQAFEHFKAKQTKSIRPFIIAELGFGLGLNFINTASLFKGENIHYIGFEKAAKTADELEQIYANFKLSKEQQSIKDELIAALKNARLFDGGFFRFEIAKIKLDLIIGEASWGLSQSEFRADFWYLDGFAPAKNPELWSEQILNEVARLSKLKAKASTYSAASSVQRGLKQAGFEIKKLKGVGKRERILVSLKNKPSLKANEQIYFSPSYLQSPTKTPQTALVIGGGIAGIASALKLKELGLEVQIIEKAPELASNGSGNAIGELEPLITKKGVLLGEFSQAASQMALSFYTKHLPDEIFKPHAAYSYAYDEKLLNRYKDLEGFEADKKRVLIKNAACLCPKKACLYLAKGLKTRLECELVGLKKDKDLWVARVLQNGKPQSLSADIVVLAMGSHSQRLFGKAWGSEAAFLNLDESLAISSVRGQSTLIKDEPNLLKSEVEKDATHSARGYLTASFDGCRVLGASFDRADYEAGLRVADDELNIKNTKEFLANAPAIMGGHAGFRAYSGDRFAIIGELHNEKAYKQDYKGIFWGKKSSTMPKYLNGLFINTAHGARGLASAILGAEIIADLIACRPLCVNKNIFAALHPARFLIRKLKKGLIKV